MYISWPTMEDVEKENNRSILIAIACTCWGNCFMGLPIPEYFGEMMATIAHKIGESATPDNIARLADEIIANK